MAITVETGSGSPTANSYISVADTDTYFTDRDNTVWNGATTADKEEALIHSAQYLDVKYHQRWKGRRANELQSLDWPRLSVVDSDDYAILSTVIPVQLKNAQAEAAVRHLSSELLPDVTNPGTIKRTQDKVGSIETEIEYFSASQIAKYSIIDGILSTLLIETGFVERS